MAKLRVDKIAAPIIKDEFTGSVHFDGTTQNRITIPSTTDFAPGTGDFTIEMWVYHTDLTGQQTYFGDTYGATSGIYTYKTSNNEISLYDTAQRSLSAQDVIKINTWHHVAWTRQNGVLRAFLDGVIVDEDTYTGSFTDTDYFIGDTAGTSSGEMVGYISNLRYCKNHAVYTSNFTVPTRELEVHTGAKGVVFSAADNRTTLLACQSSTDATADATGRHTLTASSGVTAADANPGLLRKTNVTLTVAENTGSVFFDGSGDYLETKENGNDFDFDGDFTIETWIYFDTINSNNWHDFLGSSNNSAYLGSSKSGWIAAYYTLDATGLQFRLSYQNNSAWEFELGWNYTAAVDNWYHVVYTRENGRIYCYVNGVKLTRSSTVGTVGEHATITSSEGFLRIGGGYGTALRQLDGYLSNLRICKGHAVYKSADGNFTPPTTELEVHGGPEDDRTVLLACYDGENIFADKSGRHIIAAYGDRQSTPTQSLNNSPIGITTNNPGLIRDVDPTAGPTFQGGAGFVSQGWLTLPKGTTVDRDRCGGRGIFSGGYSPGTFLNNIEYIQISTQGNSKDFGDLVSPIQIGEGGKAANHIKGLTGGGSGSPGLDQIEYIFIATTGNGVDFGDLTQNRRSLGGAGSNTRAVFVGGTTGSMTDRIDYVTIATLGDAVIFGELTVPRRNHACNASPTRGVFAGGNPGPSPYVDDTIDYITMATTGDAKDFGNLSVAQREQASAGNATRGLIAGAYTMPAGPTLNSISHITLTTLGNTLDFGDMTVGGSGRGAVSNTVNCVFGGGSIPAYTNTMDFVQIASSGNAQDFGDLGYKPFLYGGQQISDSHGGLS